jgi:hypothetical protein
MKFALEHQNPLITGNVNGETGYTGDHYSFLTVDNPNVLVWAMKPGEDGMDAGIVVRVWNVSQTDQSFSLKMGDGIKQGRYLTHIETPLGDADVQGGVLVDTLSIEQMKTYAVWLELLIEPSITPTPTPATSTPEVVITATVPLTKVSTAVPTPPSGGNGCLLGVLNALLSLLE